MIRPPTAAMNKWPDGDAVLITDSEVNILSYQSAQRSQLTGNTPWQKICQLLLHRETPWETVFNINFINFGKCLLSSCVLLFLLFAGGSSLIKHESNVVYSPDLLELILEKASLVFPCFITGKLKSVARGWVCRYEGTQKHQRQRSQRCPT